MGHPVWISFYPEGSTHEHMVLLDDGLDPSDPFKWTGEEIEDAAAELSESVYRCNSDRHDGHGHSHTTEDIKNAYSAAVNQLFTVDYSGAWQEIQKNIAKWKRWKGPVPEMVVLPDEHDSKTWNVMIPDEDGTPVMYKGNQDALKDIMPRPEEVGAVQNPHGPGWTFKQRRRPRQFN